LRCPIKYCSIKKLSPLVVTHASAVYVHCFVIYITSCKR
jgi:hypothetical protein